MLILVAWCVLERDAHQFSSGTPAPVFVEPARTHEETEAVASAQDGPGALRLLGDVLAAAHDATRYLNSPGDRALEVAFSATNRPRRTVTSIGWPTDWIARVQSRSYEDAILKKGYLAAATDPTLPPLPNRWTASDDPLRIPARPLVSFEGGDLLLRPRPERTGGATTEFVIDPGALAVVPACGVLVSVAVALLQRRRAKAADGAALGRMRGRRRRIALGAMAILSVVGLASWERTEGAIYANATLTQANSAGQPVYFRRDGYTRLPWRLHELETRATDPGFALEVASVIESAAAVNDGPYLAVAVDAESQVDRGDSVAIPASFELVEARRVTYLRRPDFGPVARVTPPAGLGVRSDPWGITLQLATGDAQKPTLALILSPGRLALLILGLFAIWSLARTLCLWRWKGGADRRLARGLCPQCGYEIGPAAP